MFPLCLAALTVFPVPAAPEPTPPNVRAAVARSLPFVEAGATTWMRDRNCNSCHVVTFLVWSHNEAAAHGIVVDRKKLAEWTKWSLADSLSDRRWFGIRARTVDGLGADGLPAELLARLKPSGKNYTTQDEFLAAMEKLLGREALDRHRESMVRRGALPNNGGGPDTLAQLLLGRAGLKEDKATADSYAAVRSLLLEWQEPDGSWQAQGQLPELKWAGAREMNDATALWGLLALGTGDPADEATARARRLALDALKKSAPGITLQTLALHAVAAHKFGDPARAAELLKDLLARQNADGGWAWVKAKPGSDAFSTGQVLYALGLLGRDGTDPAVRRGWAYLLRTQAADGGWAVPQEAVNTRARKLNVYPLWGTAWAAIGLMQTLPPDAR